ncbi:MAG: F0F1 ATP synthase subunit A [Holosporaceae bacterium]|jgi:F-type H+-transporting ATPase subunit a|nr:F0F1 ATP synthase subunit A [Holosporaceae bacterium]
MLDPFHQFVVSPILKIKVGGLDLSFTNSSLSVAVAVAAMVAIFLFGIRDKKLVPDRFQALLEAAYMMVAGLVESYVGRAGKPYFPLLLSLFLFILFGNLIGLIPGMFAFTSHIAVTFSLALAVLVSITILGFVLHGMKFFKLFTPRGVPILLVPFLFFIELTSYSIRSVSLSIRLFINMMAGHTIMEVFAGSSGVFVSPIAKCVAVIVAIGVNVFLTGLDLVVAVLQAYIFTTLACVYLNDAVHLH